MKKKMLISSVLTIVLCLSLVAGSTFALFTSTDEVNIAVTSGTVSVAAAIESMQYKTLSMPEWTDAENNATDFDGIGGTASLEGNLLTLDKIVPGDAVRFNIRIRNDSDVAIKYRTVISPVEGEMGELTARINDYKCGAGTFRSEWFLLQPNSEDIIVPVEIELPESATEQGIDCLLAFTVQAVQGNAKTSVLVTADNLATTDFSAEDISFVLTGTFDAVEIAKLGEGSTLTFDNVTATSVTLNGKNTLTGTNTLSCALTNNGTAETPAELILSDASLDLAGNTLRSGQTVDNTTAGTARLIIENSTVQCGNIFVGGHSMNQSLVTAELSVINSDVSCEENTLGSTIAVWGQNAVKVEIIDSELHTYSRGWHQSEDANDNSITFQSGGTIDVAIERSNMHLYGARSVINARGYYGTPTTNFTIDESLIWVVTKSGHGEETLPVWGATEITDSALIFTKNAYNGTTTVKSWIYGNPVIHGNYAVTTQCGWATDINVADGQTVTIASDANVSVYEGAAEVNFVLTGTACVVVEKGATLTNIGIVAAEGYTLRTNTVNGNTVYTVVSNS